MSKRRFGASLVLMLMLTVVLAACGSNSNGANENAATNGANTAGEAASQNGQNGNGAEGAEGAKSAEGAVRSITHGLGTTEITGTPLKIVALEWTYAEDLLALGIQPVGVADIKGYSSWVNVEPALNADVTDVGTRQEPNLEAIMALQPDLILTSDFRAEAIYDKLSDIAPTLAFSPYQDENGVDQYQEMIDTFNTIAEVTGKQEEAKQVLQQLDDAYAAATEKIKAAGKENAEFTLIQAYSNQNTPVLRVFTDNSLAVKTLNKIGLQSAFKEPAFEVYGYSEQSVEALPAVQDSNLLYIVQDTDNVFANQLKDNQVWKNLTFVKENRTYALGGDSWVFGGPLSAKVIVDKVTSLLAP